ncbi:pantetheine-phosphate adenylyltransferase [Bdellovibrio sp. KM01]|uniref:pantetheine-phosphate adenylyltransferase n=1 Tax=Bdellovibrio sp. KM01 TaxID=2748865 RepID=UPI0015E9F38F|nr:pantetheine-phosphate adenylyltransferase [Bdellovibrio sp. KM01]QLY25981.1 pantetheine-phosphate adenylyltransferase [Bdellovibrio sp. KM01]
MSRIAVYPGSFDPITMGHVDIINRLAPLYSEVVILVAQSAQKQAMFTADERKSLIEQSLANLKNVRVDFFEGLTVDYMKKHKAQIIIRGLRAIVDFEYELTMAQINKKIAPEIETLLMFASPECYYISSRGVKELAVNGGDLTGFVPDVVKEAITKKLKK